MIMHAHSTNMQYNETRHVAHHQVLSHHTLYIAAFGLRPENEFLLPLPKKG
jgi:hypothetical protein